MHPIHFEFIRKPPINNFRQLFAILDALPPKERDDAFMLTFMTFVNPGLDPESTERDTFGDSMTDYVNYNRFKAECERLPNNLAEFFMVYSVVSYTLSHLFNRASANLNECVKAHEDIIHRSESLMQQGTLANWQLASCQKGLERSRDAIAKMPETIQESKELYSNICNQVARPLLEQSRTLRGK